MTNDELAILVVGGPAHGIAHEKALEAARDDALLQALAEMKASRKT